MWFHYSFINNFNYHPQTKFAKVMFLHMSVCPRGGGWYPSMHCRWYPSMPCRSPGGGWYPSMPCRSPGPHPGGKLRGLAWGEFPGPHLEGGGLQAHTWGVSRPTHGGVSRPTLGGGAEGSGLGGGDSRPTPGQWAPDPHPGGYPSMH